MWGNKSKFYVKMSLLYLWKAFLHLKSNKTSNREVWYFFLHVLLKFEIILITRKLLHHERMLVFLKKKHLTNKMKRSFFQAAVASILLHGCTTWTLTKQLEKKLDGNYTRMLRAILNKSCRQHPTRHQLYGHLPPITKAIQVRRTRHAGHCWSSRDELISDVFLWTPTHGRAKAGQPARRYIQRLCEDTECCPEDLPEAMNDREKWERVRDIRATSTTWWWWWYILWECWSSVNHYVVMYRTKCNIIWRVLNIYDRAMIVIMIMNEYILYMENIVLQPKVSWSL